MKPNGELTKVKKGYLIDQLVMQMEHQVRGYTPLALQGDFNPLHSCFHDIRCAALNPTVNSLPLSLERGNASRLVWSKKNCLLVVF